MASMTPFPPIPSPQNSPPNSSLSSVERAACLASPAGMAWLLSAGRYRIARHILLLNLWLMALATRRIERAIFLMPPRHGKTELISRWFPVWYLRRSREHWVRLISYGAEYASELGGKARDLVVEHGPSIGIRLRKEASASWAIAGGGGMSTAGVGGTLTGRGANLLIIDDPIKNDQEARSKTYRDHQWEWLQATALTRLEPDGVVALVMTHWHYDDMAGRIASGQMGGERWHILRLPAVATDDELAWPRGLGRQPGEALWPQRYSAHRLGLRRQSMSPYWWSALYQQRPQLDEGTIFKRPWFRYFREVTVGERSVYRLFRADGSYRDVPTWVGFRFATVDLAASTKDHADYTSVGIWQAIPNPASPMFGHDLLLLDVIRERLEGPDQQKLMGDVYRRYGLAYVAIERAGYQLTMVQSVRRAGVPVRELVADRDKVARAMGASPMVEQGQVFFRLDAPWLGPFETELLQFPSGSHDDQVDMTSYAVRHIASMGTSENLEASGDEPGLPTVF